VLGGTVFFGRHLVAALIAGGHRVTMRATRDWFAHSGRTTLRAGLDHKREQE
jgi:uncharacterized protein YbjT (DUF2867 family)